MNRLRAFDWLRIARTGRKFLMSVGVITLGGWLPAQSWIIALSAVAMFVPMFYLLYFMEGESRGREKVESDLDPNR